MQCSVKVEHAALNARLLEPCLRILWFEFERCLQRNERLGSDLYLSSFQPPALILARPVPAERFVDGLATLRPLLDKKAKEEPSAENGVSDEE